MSTLEALARFGFEVPAELEAGEPPEARGLARDEVRLMVADRTLGRLMHARFRDLPEILEAGDLLVINTSKTIPASLPRIPSLPRNHLAVRSSGWSPPHRFASCPRWSGLGWAPGWRFHTRGRSW